MPEFGSYGLSIRANMLNDLSAEIHEWAEGKGFWDHQFIRSSGVPGISDGEIMATNPSIYEEKLMLIVSEAAEVLEARRDGDEALEQEECADILIRVLDYCGARGFDIGPAVVAKMAVNRNRPHLHGRMR
jgi:NTP pyrophosphatase (non-canonical NTP hydrolase)